MRVSINDLIHYQKEEEEDEEEDNEWKGENNPGHIIDQNAGDEQCLENYQKFGGGKFETPEMKMKRLQKEKEKRDEISNGIVRLQKMVPKLNQLQKQNRRKTKDNSDPVSKRTSRATILKSSAQYIKDLEKEIEGLQTKISHYEDTKTSSKQDKELQNRLNDYKRALNKVATSGLGDSQKSKIRSDTRTRPVSSSSNSLLYKSNDKTVKNNVGGGISYSKNNNIIDCSTIKPEYRHIPHSSSSSSSTPSSSSSSSSSSNVSSQSSRHYSKNYVSTDQPDSAPVYSHQHRYSSSLSTSSHSPNRIVSNGISSYQHPNNYQLQPTKKKITLPPLQVLAGHRAGSNANTIWNQLSYLPYNQQSAYSVVTSFSSQHQSDIQRSPNHQINPVNYYANPSQRPSKSDRNHRNAEVDHANSLSRYRMS